MSARRYRIFHLIKSLGRGGAEVLLKEGYGYRDENRFDYGYGYFLPWKNALVPELKGQGAEVVCFDSGDFKNMTLKIPQLSRFFNEWRADLVHCHLPLAGATGRIAARLAGVPVVYTEHNMMERYNRWTRLLNLQTWNWQRHVIAVSRQVKHSIEKHAGDQVPVTVVENGIPVHRFSRSDTSNYEIRKLYSIPNDAFVVGTVAVFRPQKDLRNWILAAREIKKQIPNAHFLLVGDGPLMSDVRSLAAECELNGAAHFAGLQAESAPFFSAMNVYMCSSVFEGMPLSLLEAMATSLPVVATTVGGVPDVVEDKQSGRLVSPNQPQMLAEEVCILYQQSDLRAQYGARGHEIVSERFGMKRMIENLESIYYSVLE